jgi:hypothetical protein
MKINLLKISIILLILTGCAMSPTTRENADSISKQHKMATPIATSEQQQMQGNRVIPISTAYPTSKQHKIQAAHHWDVLAKDLAKRLKKTLEITFPNVTVKPPIVVNLTGDQEKIPFAKAFNNLLISRLVQQQMVVLETNSGYVDSLTVDYNMQVIQHQYPRLLSANKIWEVLITTSVSKGQQYIFRDSRIYYINGGDSDHYERDIGTKTYQVRN